MNSDFNESDYMSSTFLEEAQNLDYERKQFLGKKKIVQLNNKEKDELMYHKLKEDNAKPLNSKNKGFQMLKRMGFKEGETLGINNNGLKEPIIPKTDIPKRQGIGNNNSSNKPSGNLSYSNDSKKQENSKSGLLSALHYSKINKCKYKIIKNLKVLSNLLESRFPEITEKYYKTRKVINLREDCLRELEEFVENIIIMKGIIEKKSMNEEEIESYFDYLNLTLEKFDKICIKENLILKLKEKINKTRVVSCLDILKNFSEIEEYLNEFNEQIIEYISRNMYYCTFCQTQYSSYQDFSSTCIECEYKEEEE